MGRLDQIGNVDTTGISPGDSETIEGVAAHDVFSLGTPKVTVSDDGNTVDYHGDALGAENVLDPRKEGFSPEQEDDLAGHTFAYEEGAGDPGVINGFRLGSNVRGQEAQVSNFDSTEIGVPYPGEQTRAATAEFAPSPSDPTVPVAQTEDEAAEITEDVVTEELSNVDDLHELTVPELRLKANDLPGVEVKASDRKDDIIAKIEAHLAKSEDDEEEVEEEDAEGNDSAPADTTKGSTDADVETPTDEEESLANDTPTAEEIHGIDLDGDDEIESTEEANEEEAAAEAEEDDA